MYGSASEAFGENIKNIRGSKDKVKEKMGFAKGPGNDDDIKSFRKKAEEKLENVDIQLTENIGGILSDWEKQKFDMDAQQQQLKNQRKLAERQSETKYFGVFG